MVIKMAKYFKCITDKNPVSYKLGDEIKFTVFAREDGENIDWKNVEWRMEGDDGQYFEGKAQIGENSPLELSYTLKRAGFVHLVCVAQNENGEKAEGFDQLDASAGVDVLSLSYSDTLPEDFEEYWAEIEDLVSNYPIEVIEFKEQTEGISEGYRAYDVKIKTPTQRPASGRITVPKKEGRFPLRISFLGYGIHPTGFVYEEDKICACFNAHGFENDKPEEELIKIYGKELSWYGFHNEENASNKTTYYRNMMIRNLIALKFTKTLPAWNGKDIISAGGSQGALQAITVAAHDSDVTEVLAYKPWFCDLKSIEDGYLKGWRPDVAEGLRYFDTVAQAMHIKCPIFIECYLGDYVCPPKTVMALYNSIKAEKKIKFIQSATHSYFAPENEDVENIF